MQGNFLHLISSSLL